MPPTTRAEQRSSRRASTASFASGTSPRANSSAHHSPAPTPRLGNVLPGRQACDRGIRIGNGRHLERRSILMEDARMSRRPPGPDTGRVAKLPGQPSLPLRLRPKRLSSPGLPQLGGCRTTRKMVSRARCCSRLQLGLRRTDGFWKTRPLVLATFMRTGAPTCPYAGPEGVGRRGPRRGWVGLVDCAGGGLRGMCPWEPGGRPLLQLLRVDA